MALAPSISATGLPSNHIRTSYWGRRDLTPLGGPREGGVLCWPRESLVPSLVSFNMPLGRGPHTILMLCEVVWPTLARCGHIALWGIGGPHGLACSLGGRGGLPPLVGVLGLPLACPPRVGLARRSCCPPCLILWDSRFEFLHGILKHLLHRLGTYIQDSSSF